MIEKFMFQRVELEGAYIIRPFYSSDDRGSFIKDYNIEEFRKHNIDHELKEVFYTISHKGVIRAIHFQIGHPQAKLVRCIKGKIYDVIVDLRKNSETYGQWRGYELSGRNRKELYIPKCFGHGYLVLEESIVSYKCGEVFYSEGDSGIMYNDPDIGIQWPFELIGGKENMIISEKDKHLMSFQDYKRSEMGSDDR